MTAPRRVDEIHLLPKAEVHRRLRELMASQDGKHQSEMDFSLAALAIFVNHSKESTKQCAFGIVSDNMQLRLSQFFERWDRGEVSFTWQGRRKPWLVVFHNPPRPVKAVVRPPRIDFATGRLTFF